jgi:hypothetical protein
MMDGGKYAPEITPSGEKIVASVIVAGWLVLAWHHDGFTLASDAFQTLFIPLAMIWIPEQLARFVTVRPDDDPTPPSPRATKVVRFVGWFVILAVPAWWAFVLPAAGD